MSVEARTQLLEQAFGAETATAFAKWLENSQKIAFEAYAHKVKSSGPLHEELSTLSRKVPKFWLNAMSNSSGTAALIDPIDRDALAFLEDVKIVHGSDVRDYTIEFHFSAKNPFFKDTILKKAFTVTPPSGSEHDAPAPYDLEADLFMSATKINWTSKDHDLTKKAPRVKVEDVEEYDEFTGLGSFFNLFSEEGPDEHQLGELLLEWWSHAVEYAAGMVISADSDDEGFDGIDSDDDEDDEDPTKEIDLESEEDRPKKKAKK